MDVRGGWYIRPPKDIFDAQYAPVCAWGPIPLGRLVDWACWMGALSMVWECSWACATAFLFFASGVRIVCSLVWGAVIRSTD